MDLEFFSDQTTVLERHSKANLFIFVLFFGWNPSPWPAVSCCSTDSRLRGFFEEKYHSLDLEESLIKVS